MTEVELHPAFVWDCDECGSQNFERAIIPPFATVEEEEIARDILDVAVGEGFPVMAPMQVLCRVCGADFKTDVTQIYGDDADEFTYGQSDDD
jgi:hypothetical protein